MRGAVSDDRPYRDLEILHRSAADQAITGRPRDGKNGNIGFLNVLDAPCPEMAASARGLPAAARGIDQREIDLGDIKFSPSGIKRTPRSWQTQPRNPADSREFHPPTPRNPGPRGLMEILDHHQIRAC